MQCKTIVDNKTSYTLLIGDTLKINDENYYTYMDKVKTNNLQSVKTCFNRG